MTIRAARAQDVDAVAPLMWQAMPEVVAHWVGDDERSAGIAFLKQWFVKKDNIYSFENTLVYADGDEILASITGYDGGREAALRAPLLAVYPVAVESETQAGEWYVDTVSVAAACQGQGVGGNMLRAFAEHVRVQGGTRVGLLVDVEKPAAQRLYERLGFQVQGEKRLSGGLYRHLQLVLLENGKK